MAFGEIGGTGEASLGPGVEEDVEAQFAAGGFCGELVGIIVADRRTAGFLNPNFKAGLEALFKTGVGAGPPSPAEDCFCAADANEYAHEWQRVRL